MNCKCGADWDKYEEAIRARSPKLPLVKELIYGCPYCQARFMRQLIPLVISDNQLSDIKTLPSGRRLKVVRV